MRFKHFFGKAAQPKRWSLPVFSTLFFYLTALFFSGLFFDIQFERKEWIFVDGLVSLAVSYLLLCITRSNKAFLLLQALGFYFLFFAHSLKIAFYGGPLVVSDLFSFMALLNILIGWQFWALIFFLGVTVVILFSTINVFRRESIIGLIGFAVMIAMVSIFPAMINRTMDRYLYYNVWSQRINFENRGPFLYTLHETVRYLASRPEIPDQKTVQAAKVLLAKYDTRTLTSSSAVSDKRNVHIILLESFWDPHLLEGIHFSQDPFYPSFRKLWAQTKFSTVNVPVFGGYTSNTEFEILCGYPVEENGVKFERHVKKNVPCLPAIFKTLGYETFASHPNIASFWNRNNVYPRLGFEHTFFINDYQHIDMAKDEFMGDSTYYNQTAKLIDNLRDDRKPIFNYMVTIFGHLPYPLTENRPEIITADNASENVLAYANNVYYKSKEVMDEITNIQSKDPNALIVLFGDHLPNLGNNFAGYSDTGFLGKNKSEFSAQMLVNMHKTPLIILDGEKGPVQLGNRSMFELPLLIMDLLAFPDIGIFRYSQLPKGKNLRPLPGQLIDNEERVTHICRTEGQCPEAEEWMNAIRIIVIDLFEGHQHALQP